MSRPDSSAPVLGAFVLGAAALQLLATIQLGLANHDALARAAAEGAKYYLIGGIASLVGLVGVWVVRARPLVAAGLFVVWQAAVYWPLRGRTTKLGLAYHGEFILHHFASLVAAALLLRLAWQLWRRTDLPRLRVIVVGLATLTALVSVTAHLWLNPGVAEHPKLPSFAGVGPILAVGTWVAAVAVFWRRLQPLQIRIATAVLALPWVVRLAAGGTDGLFGEAVPYQGRPYVMVSLVIAGVAAFVLIRPKLARALWTLVMVSSFLGTAMLYVVYRRGFGDLEDGLGGLAVSIFGFVPPYPQYVPAYQGIAVMLGLFGVFVAAYASLIAMRTRPRGVALSLLIVSGIGLTSPQLWLMVGAGGLLLVASALPVAATAAARTAPPRPLEPMLEAVAAKLGVPAPVVLDTDEGSLVAIRGELDEQPLDVRARPLDDDGWAVTITIGTPGRAKPDVEIIPDGSGRGERPAHLLSRTHKLRGSRADREALDDALLDPLVALPDAHLQLWVTGARLDLGEDLRAMSVTGLVDLIDALRDRV